MSKSPNRQCQDCGGYERDNGVDDVCECYLDDEDNICPDCEYDYDYCECVSICNDCNGNGYTNPPEFNLKCKKCCGKGIIK